MVEFIITMVGLILACAAEWFGDDILDWWGAQRQKENRMATTAPTGWTENADVLVGQYEEQKHTVTCVPVEESSNDLAWQMVMGIPILTWINAAIRCHGPHGFEFGPERIAYLRQRREWGDFREPVDLVKRARRLPEPKPIIAMDDMNVLVSAFGVPGPQSYLVQFPDVKSYKELHEVLKRGLSEPVPLVDLVEYSNRQKARLAAKQRCACTLCGKSIEMREAQSIFIYDPDTGDYLGSISVCWFCEAESNRLSRR